jgi:DNA modification methylase
MGKKRAGAAALPSSKNNPAGNARVERPEAPGARTRLKVRRVRVADLFADPKNARKHGERNLAAVKESLRRFGQRMPIVVDANNVVRAGNARLEAAKQLGWDEIDVVDLPFDGAAAAAFALADNRTAELAEWNEEALVATLREFEFVNDDDLPGFTEQELATFTADVDADAAGDKFDAPAPEAMDTPISRTGDLWVMGKHRLLCGNSAERVDLDRLLGGAKIHLVNTDPPYNVKVEPRSNNAIRAGLSSFSETTPKGAPVDSNGLMNNQRFDARRQKKKNTSKMRAKDRPLANDFVTDEAFEAMLLAWFGNMSYALIEGGGFYIWGGYANVANYPPAMKAAKLYFSQSIIWDKQHPVLTRKDFMGAHEWCFYGWKEGASHRWFGPTNAQDLWAVKKVNPQSMVHLTEKPVELAARALEYSSQAGENVLDLFGCSGSTLMACEKLSRCGFLMELDTAYCDVIVRRWQQVTGHAARLDGTRKTFEAVAAERGVQLPEPVAAVAAAV